MSAFTAVILNGDYQLPFTMDNPAWGIVMGFEHERIHLETSSVLMRELPQHLVTRPAQVMHQVLDQDKAIFTQD